MRRASPRSPPSAAPGRGLRRLHVPRVRWPPPAPARALPAVPAAVASSVGVCGAGLCAERLPRTPPSPHSSDSELCRSRRPWRRNHCAPERRRHPTVPQAGTRGPAGPGLRTAPAAGDLPVPSRPCARGAHPDAVGRAAGLMGPLGPCPHPQSTVRSWCPAPALPGRPLGGFLQGMVPRKRFPPVSQLSDEALPPPSLMSVWHLLEFGAQMLPSGQYFLLLIPHTSDPTVTAIKPSSSFFFLLLL